MAGGGWEEKGGRRRMVCNLNEHINLARKEGEAICGTGERSALSTIAVQMREKDLSRRSDACFEKRLFAHSEEEEEKGELPIRGKRPRPASQEKKVHGSAEEKTPFIAGNQGANLLQRQGWHLQQQGKVRFTSSSKNLRRRHSDKRGRSRHRSDQGRRKKTSVLIVRGKKELQGRECAARPCFQERKNPRSCRPRGEGRKSVRLGPLTERKNRKVARLGELALPPIKGGRGERRRGVPVAAFRGRGGPSFAASQALGGKRSSPMKNAGKRKN